MATKLEHCQIHTSHIHQELSLPLTHFDIPFLKSDPTQRLIFFNFPSSKSHFLETIIPALKKSLSTTLTHFLPLAGKIILPSNYGMPEIRCVPGNSVSLTIAQSDQDFNSLTGNHQRLADEFYSCLPQLPPVNRFSDFIVFPVAALQITLFPGQGICIGLTNYHALGDERSTVLKTWALANRFGDGTYLMDVKSLPVFDRNLVQDPEKLNSRAWDFVKNTRNLPVELPPATSPINKVRSTFIMCLCLDLFGEIRGRGKRRRRAGLFHLHRRLPEAFKPTAAESYFGNCVVFVIAESRRGLLKKTGGFLIAVESIGETVRKTVWRKGDRGECRLPAGFRGVRRELAGIGGGIAEI